MLPKRGSRLKFSLEVAEAETLSSQDLLPRDGLA